MKKFFLFFVFLFLGAFFFSESSLSETACEKLENFEDKKCGGEGICNSNIKKCKKKKKYEECFTHENDPGSLGVSREDFDEIKEDFEKCQEQEKKDKQEEKEKESDKDELKKLKKEYDDAQKSFEAAPSKFQKEISERIINLQKKIKNLDYNRVLGENVRLFENEIEQVQNKYDENSKICQEKSLITYNKWRENIGKSRTESLSKNKKEFLHKHYNNCIRIHKEQYKEKIEKLKARKNTLLIMNTDEKAQALKEIESHLSSFDQEYQNKMKTEEKILNSAFEKYQKENFKVLGKKLLDYKKDFKEREEEKLSKLNCKSLKEEEEKNYKTRLTNHWKNLETSYIKKTKKCFNELNTIAGRKDDDCEKSGTKTEKKENNDVPTTFTNQNKIEKCKEETKTAKEELKDLCCGGQSLKHLKTKCENISNITNCASTTSQTRNGEGRQ